MMLRRTNNRFSGFVTCQNGPQDTGVKGTLGNRNPKECHNTPGKDYQQQP